MNDILYLWENVVLYNTILKQKRYNENKGSCHQNEEVSIKIDYLKFTQNNNTGEGKVSNHIKLCTGKNYVYRSYSMTLLKECLWPENSCKCPKGIKNYHNI